MESSNSGSFQSSSSGDDEEFESRFLNVPPPPHLPPPSTTSSSSFFDPMSPYLASFLFPPAAPLPPSPPPPNSLNLDHPWSKAIQQPPSLSTRSTCTTTITNPVAAARSSPAASTSNTRPMAPAAQAGQSAAAVSTAAAPRGSKKRTRASRRAPTTVLATDTSNFRAMVQQFTGFPAPPFASSTPAPFTRPRLDFFNIAASGGGGAPISSYLLRPFPQKILSAAAAASFPPMAPTTSSSTSSSALEAMSTLSRSTPDVNAPAANSASTNSSCRATSIFNTQNPRQFDLQGANFFSPNQLLHSPKYSSQSLVALGARSHHQSSSNSTMGGGELESFNAGQAMKSSSTNWVEESGVVQDQNEEQGRSKD